MEPFTRLEAVAAPMDMINIDTDMIIPKQFLKSIKRSGFGPNLFDELRYLDEGRPGEDCSQRPINPCCSTSNCLSCRRQASTCGVSSSKVSNPGTTRHGNQPAAPP